MVYKLGVCFISFYRLQMFADQNRWYDWKCHPGWIEPPAVSIQASSCSPSLRPQSRLALFAVSQQMPPSWDPRHMEPVVSQVLLILIGSGMTYCQGEGDCHGPTGMGAEGMWGWRREEWVSVWVRVWARARVCVSVLSWFLENKRKPVLVSKFNNDWAINSIEDDSPVPLRHTQCILDRWCRKTEIFLLSWWLLCYLPSVWMQKY